MEWWKYEAQDGMGQWRVLYTRDDHKWEQGGRGCTPGIEKQIISQFLGNKTIVVKNIIFCPEINSH